MVNDKRTKVTGNATGNDFYRNRRSRGGQSAEILMHNHEDIDKETDDSKLKQILSMYGLVNVNGAVQ